MAVLYLADTSAWNRFAQGSAVWKERLIARQLAVCAPVLLEVLYSARGSADYRQLAQDLALMPQLPLTESATHEAVRTQARLAERSQHRGPTPVDLLVAAIARAGGATVLHYDRHFDAIARVTGQPTEWLARRGTLD